MTSTQRSRSGRSRSSRKRVEAPRLSLYDEIEATWWPQIVAALAVLSGLGAGLAGASPTGLQFADVVLSVLVGAALVPFLAMARRWSWLICSGMLALVATDPFALICAVSAVVVAFAAVVAGGSRRRIIGAIVAVLAVQAAFRQGDLIVQGASLVWSMLAFTAPVLSGYRLMRIGTRRKVFYSGVGAIGVAVVLSALAGIGAVATFDDLSQARQATDRAFTALRAGEQDEAAAAFDEASVGFVSASGRLERPWIQASRLVPVVGQQTAAATTVADAGAELTGMAGEAVLGARYSEVRPTAGRVDLVQVEAMQPVVDELAGTMANTEARLGDVDSSWLLPAVGDPLRSAVDQLTESRPEVELAQELLDVLPWLLGDDATRRYLVLFANPAESRFLGGFVGGYGILEATDGQVDLVQSGRIGELGVPANTLDDTGFEPELANRYSRWSPERFLQNASLTPDFPTDAALARRLAPEFGLGAIDGVIYVDPIAIAALLELTGPVELDELDEPLTAENAQDLLLRRQYEEYSEKDDRNDLVAAAAEATFEALTERDLPGPGRVAEVLGPIVRQGRLLVETVDETANGPLATVGLVGAFPRAGQGDFLALRVANNAPNKLDTYLARSLDYQVEFEPRTGATTAVLDIELVNNAPDGLPEYTASNAALVAEVEGAPPLGTNIAFVSIYSRLDLDVALVDGSPVSVEIMPEFGHRTYSMLVEIPRGGAINVQLNLYGDLPTDTYVLDVVGQPIVEPENLTLSVRASDASALQPLEALRQPSAGPAVPDPSEFTLEGGGNLRWSGMVDRWMRFLYAVE